MPEGRKQTLHVYTGMRAGMHTHTHTPPLGVPTTRGHMSVSVTRNYTKELNIDVRAEKQSNRKIC